MYLGSREHSLEHVEALDNRAVALEIWALAVAVDLHVIWVCDRYPKQCHVPLPVEMVIKLWFHVNADSSRCEECGHEDQLCCPALVPEMKHGVCSMGMGCTNNVQLISERKCKPCGEKNAPCCWDLQTGYTCNDELHCSGTIGGVTLMR